MTPISSEVGHALQIVLMEELRPFRGGTFFPDFIDEVVKRYRFASFPTELSQAQPGAKFQVGTMRSGDLSIVINALEIYNDGIVVNTRNTDDADLVMDDFAGWATNQFKLREPVTKMPRTYSSAVVVQFDASFSQIIQNFTALQNIIGKFFQVAEGMDVLRLAVGNDPFQTPGHKTWQIEPRQTKPYVPNRYFSTAQLQTGAHFDMLAELEGLMRPA